MLAYDLPPGSWVLFLRGLIPTTGSAWNPAGQGPLGAGTTCIINPVGSAYPVRPIAMDGSVEWLNPLGTGPGMDAQWGDLFSFRDVPFQAWYRDVDASGAATSNLTNVALVTMRQE